MCAWWNNKIFPKYIINNKIKLRPKSHFCIYIFNIHCVMKNALEMKLRAASVSNS